MVRASPCRRPRAEPRRPIGEYGIGKAAIEAFLLDEARRTGFPATIAHPGHIVGPGWAPLNPAGHFNPRVFTTLARGEELALPNFGMETVHHVHADDVAQMFMRAIANWSSSVGEAFHTVSPAAVSLRGYAEAMAAWFGQKPNLVFLPWPEWKARQSEEEATATWEHIFRSPSSSIAKAQRLLGYQPRYTSFEAVQRVGQLADRTGDRRDDVSLPPGLAAADAASQEIAPARAGDFHRSSVITAMLSMFQAMPFRNAAA